VSEYVKACNAGHSAAVKSYDDKKIIRDELKIELFGEEKASD